MVIVILQDDYAFSFEMASWDKEKMLVERFNAGDLSPTTVLDLKSKGSFKVSEIKGMEWQAVKVIKKEEEKPKASKEDKFKKDFEDAIRARSKRKGKDQKFWNAMDDLKPKPKKA